MADNEKLVKNRKKNFFENMLKANIEGKLNVTKLRVVLKLVKNIQGFLITRGIFSLQYSITKIHLSHLGSH